MGRENEKVPQVKQIAQAIPYISNGMWDEAEAILHKNKLPETPINTFIPEYRAMVFNLMSKSTENLSKLLDIGDPNTPKWWMMVNDVMAGAGIDTSNVGIGLNNEDEYKIVDEFNTLQMRIDLAFPGETKYIEVTSFDESKSIREVEISESSRSVTDLRVTLEYIKNRDWNGVLGYNENLDKPTEMRRLCKNIDWNETWRSIDGGNQIKSECLKLIDEFLPEFDTYLDSVIYPNKEFDRKSLYEVMILQLVMANILNAVGILDKNQTITVGSHPLVVGLIMRDSMFQDKVKALNLQQ